MNNTAFISYVESLNCVCARTHAHLCSFFFEDAYIYPRRQNYADAGMLKGERRFLKVTKQQKPPWHGILLGTCAWQVRKTKGVQAQ